jgi:Beta-lactamase class A
MTLKKPKIIIILSLIAAIAVLAMVMVFLFVRRPADNYTNISTLGTPLITNISDPETAIIREGEVTSYQITLNKTVSYTEGTIVADGPASVVFVSGGGTDYTVSVRGESGTGKVLLTIPDGTFNDSNGNETSEAFKAGLVVDNTDKLKLLVEEYLADDVDNIGLFFYDINSEVSFGIGEDEQVYPASVSKLHTVVSLYDFAFENKIDINKEIDYTRGDYEAGTGILQGMDLTRPYDLLTLSDYAIIHSDNIAFNMILRVAGREEIRKNYGKVVGHDAVTQSGVIYMSAKDSYLFMRKIYENKEGNTLFSRLIDNMKNTTTAEKIAKYLPSGIVARKSGTFGAYSHDVAIVYDENPYILTVLTSSLGGSNEKIGQIAKLIHENR